MEVVVFLISCSMLGFLFFSLRLLRSRWGSPTDLPPGSTGWPVIGESLDYLATGWKGHPEKFVFDRMERFSRQCFRTSIIGESNMAVMCGADGNKFLFSNENRLVTVWWPTAVRKLLFPALSGDANSEARKLRTVVMQFLKPEALRRFVGVMDSIAALHFAESWEGKDEVLVFALAKRYTFWVPCKLFMSLDDPNHIMRLLNPFLQVTPGLVTFPINFPGTPFYRATKAVKLIIKELKVVTRQRKLDLANNNAIPTQDILSHMLTTPIEDETGGHRFMNVDDIANKIIGFLLAGHDTASSAITFIIKYLADLPHVYDQVYKGIS